MVSDRFLMVLKLVVLPVAVVPDVTVEEVAVVDVGVVALMGVLEVGRMTSASTTESLSCTQPVRAAPVNLIDFKKS